MDDKFIPVHSFNDLKQFGINFLTGESCAYAMRLLCDVNEDGRALLADFFGMPDIQLAKNWNSSVNEKPSVGSFMLPRSILKELAQFAFFKAGARAVAHSPHSIIGIFTEERFEGYRKLNEGIDKPGFSFCRNLAMTSGAPMAGSRNVHAFSGRAA